MGADIMKNKLVREEAKHLPGDAILMLDELSANKSLNPRSVVGNFPANPSGDDMEIYANESHHCIFVVSNYLLYWAEKTRSYDGLFHTAAR